MDRSDSEELIPLRSGYSLSKSRRDIRSPKQQKLAEYFVLVSTLLERAAFYALATNLVVHLDSSALLDWSSQNSSVAAFIFFGITNISTIASAIISDAKSGRAKTIVFGFVLYIIGYILAILVTTPDIHMCIARASNKTNDLYSVTLIKEPCAEWILTILVIIGVGAGSIQSNMAVFGAEQIPDSRPTSRYFDKYMIAINIGGIVGTLTTSLIKLDPKSYFHGYVIAAVYLVVAFLLFIIGNQYYIKTEPYDTVVVHCIPVTITACRLKCQSHNEDNTIQSDDRPSRFFDLSSAATSGKFSERMVRDVISLRRAFFVFVLLIPYFLIYHQLNATFPLQGEHMHRPSDIKNIATLMSLGDPIIIVSSDESSMSVYILSIQSICMGVSEVFAMVASYEFAYFAAPQSAQSLFMSLRFASIGVSSFIGSGFMAWFPTSSFNIDFSCRMGDIANWPFYTYFYILAGVQFIFMMIFIICHKKFNIIRMNSSLTE
ncbi:unnamed protein product [Adineta steineri]|uniref:Uncharacterized protein n=1 Tax=Adineta steineri TaxID=433720 RepID=A0A819BK45_9BILA|nr:unnamed protein product [Adineta steineri]